MTAPQPAPDEQPGLTPTEDAVIAVLAAALLDGSLFAGTAIPLYLLLRLTALGIDRTAARAAIRLGLSEPVGRRAGPTVAGTAIGQVRAAEPELRARYIVAAARRITDALRHGSTVFTGLRAEARYFRQHRDAARGRRAAARQVDKVAARSPWLEWRTQGDARVEADCAALAGSLFTIDNPPTLAGRVVWPGMVHPHCRCYPAVFGASSALATATVTATR